VYPLPSPHDIDDWKRFPLRGSAECWWVDTKEAKEKLKREGWCCGIWKGGQEVAVCGGADGEFEKRVEKKDGDVVHIAEGVEENG
jgi:hypothetical protein